MKGRIAGFWLGAVLFANADEHVGPVTDLAVHAAEIFSCSQAGVARGLGDGLRLMASPAGRVTSLALDPKVDGRMVVAGGSPGASGMVGVLQPGQEPQFRELGADLVYDVVLTVGGDLVVAACADGRVVSLPTSDLSAAPRVLHRHTAAARAVATSPDGQWLASAGLDGVIILSRLDGDGDPSPEQLLDHTAGVECLQFSPDSRFLASGSRDSKVRLHDRNGSLVRTYVGLGMENEPVAGRVDSRVLSLAWHEAVLVAGTSKGSLYRLSLDDDTYSTLERESKDPVFSLGFDATGHLLLGSHGRVEQRTLEGD